MMRAILVEIGAALLVSSCVSAGAGIDRVRASVDAPIARELSVLEEGAPDDRIRALLAEPIDSETAVRIALLSNPEVQASLARLGIARGALWTASLLPNPELDLSFYLGDEVELEGELLFDLGSLVTTPLARQAAETELTAEAADAALDILSLAHRTRVAFVRYQTDRRTRDVLQTVVEASRASWEAAQVLRDAGNLSALELSQEEALYQEARLALTGAELRLLESREALNVQMGLFGGELDWEAVDAPERPPDEELPLDRLEARAVEASIVLSALRERMRATGQRMTLARAAGALPRVRAGVAVRREDQEWTFGPALSVGLPIFSQNQGMLVTQEAQLSVLERRYEGRAIELRSLVRRARNRMVIARERERFLRETLLPLRQRVLDETVAQYNAMNASVFQILNARRAQLESALEHVEALGEYERARAALEHLLAGGWLELPEVAPVRIPPRRYNDPRFGR